MDLTGIKEATAVNLEKEFNKLYKKIDERRCKDFLNSRAITPEEAESIRKQRLDAALKRVTDRFHLQKQLGAVDGKALNHL